jgi:hypothetical protein
MDIDERLSLYLVDIIKDDEQIKHTHHDVENVNIIELSRTQIDKSDILVVKYIYDVVSRLDRKWRLKGKPGNIQIPDSELTQYYRDIRIDQIFE